jgi:hypothetical protein
MLAYREEYAILRLDKVSNRARERRTKMAQNKDKPTNKLVVLATIIGIAGFFGLVFSPAGHAVSNTNPQTGIVKMGNHSKVCSGPDLVFDVTLVPNSVEC